MSRVSLARVQEFVKDLGLDPATVTELHITSSYVRVIRILNFDAVEVDIVTAEQCPGCAHAYHPFEVCQCGCDDRVRSTR